jgi:tetratricopeptide (TPR) repeat protein
MSRRHFAPALAIAGVLTTAAAGAHAKDAADADALFEQGRALITEGRVAEACAKFEASLALDPVLGTRLNLGLCWEQLGRVLDAIGALEQVVADATTTDLAAFRTLASEHLTALYGRRSYLTVTTTGTDDLELVLQRGSAAERPLRAGVEIVLDPSARPDDQVTVIARTAAPAATELARETLTLQPGERRALSLVTAAVVDAAPHHDERDVGSRAPRRRGLIIAGAGLVGLGASAVVGLIAKRRYDAAVESECEIVGGAPVCSPAGVAATGDAIDLARWVASPLGVAGLAALAVGTIVWIRDRRGPDAPDADHVALGPLFGDAGALGLAAAGTF